MSSTWTDGDRIRTYFGRCDRVEGTEVLGRIAWEGVPMEVHTGGDLEIELAYGSHRSVVKYEKGVLIKVAVDIAHDRAKVSTLSNISRGYKYIRFGWLRGGKEKLRVIHNLTLRGGKADVRKAGGTREQKATLETRGRSVNVDTD